MRMRRCQTDSKVHVLRNMLEKEKELEDEEDEEAEEEEQMDEYL